jgi:hypothetical protein
MRTNRDPGALIALPVVCHVANLLLLSRREDMKMQRLVVSLGLIGLVRGYYLLGFTLVLSASGYPLIEGTMNEPTVVLEEEDRVRPCWAIGFQAQPSIEFQLQSVCVRASNIAINYFSVGRGVCRKVVIFDEAGKVVSANALRGERSPASLAQQGVAVRLVDYGT